MAGKTFAKAAAKPAAKASAAPQAAAKKEYVPKENEFGTFKNITPKSGKKFQAIEVAQDMTLTKGQLIVFQSLDEKLEWLVNNNHITADQAAERHETQSEWLIGEFRVLPPRDQ